MCKKTKTDASGGITVCLEAFFGFHVPVEAESGSWYTSVG